jgi:branched-chain amino acid transport system substrate-binding protein
MRRFVARLCLMSMIAAGCGSPAAQPPIFLGHVATLSGPDSRAGKQAERGIQLALEELGLPASEKLFNRPVVVRHVDGAGNLDSMEAAAARLVSVNRAVALLGGAGKDEALRLDRVRVPVLAPAGLRTSAMSELLFTTGLAPARQGELLAKHLADSSAAPLALIVDNRRDETQTFAEAFKKTWAQAAAKAKDSAAPLEIGFGKDAKFTEVAARAGKPKTVVFAGAADDFRALRRELKGLSWVYAGDDGSLMPADLSAGETVLVATAFAAKEGKAADFAKKYRDKFQDEATVHAALAYDNLRLVVEALQKGQSSAPDKLREELLKIKDFAGLTGPLSFAPDQHLSRPAFIAELRSEGMAVVKTIAP